MEVDPLDEYMATLEVDAAVALDGSSVTPATSDLYSWRSKTLRDHELSHKIKNRRFRRLQQLLHPACSASSATRQSIEEVHEAQEQVEEASGWYFSDEQMKRRSPALFDLYVGRFETSVPKAPTTCNLSEFLLATCDRQELEQRRQQEHATWHYKEKPRAHEEDEEEEQQQEEEEEDVGEEGEDEEELSIQERRSQLVDVMAQRFLQGLDDEFVDYPAIDEDETLDDLDQEQQDAEDAYFESD